MHKLLGGGVEWGKQEIGAIWQCAAMEAECHHLGGAPAVPRCHWKLQVTLGLVVPSLLFFLSPSLDAPLTVLFWAYTTEIGLSSVKAPKQTEEVHRISVCLLLTWPPSCLILSCCCAAGSGTLNSDSSSAPDHSPVSKNGVLSGEKFEHYAEPKYSIVFSLMVIQK